MLKTPNILVACACASAPGSQGAAAPPPTDLPLARYLFRPLEELLFCESCESLCCETCVLSEPSSHYCPDCLCDVSSSQFEAEHGRCPRFCSRCPVCSHALTPTAGDAGASDAARSFHYCCAQCRWRSVGVLEAQSPSALATLLAKTPPLASTEYARLVAHFQPHVRRITQELAGARIEERLQGPMSPQRRATYGVQTQAFSPVKDRRTGQFQRRMVSTVGLLDVIDDSMPEYVAEKRANSSAAAAAAARELEARQTLPGGSVDGSARADTSHAVPQRTHVRTKRSKRCPSCAHLLVRPEIKVDSHRYRIKLVASNFVPALTLVRCTLASSELKQWTTKRVLPPHVPVSPEMQLRPGKSYTFALTVINPLFSRVRLKLVAMRPPGPSGSPTKGGSPVKSPPYAVIFRPSQFAVDAHTEDWEYEVGAAGGADTAEGVAPSPDTLLSTAGNRTSVRMEVATGQHFEGPLRIVLLVTVTPENNPEAARASEKVLKEFSFWTLCHLGTVVPRAPK